MKIFVFLSLVLVIGRVKAWGWFWSDDDTQEEDNVATTKQPDEVKTEELFPANPVRVLVSQTGESDGVLGSAQQAADLTMASLQAKMEEVIDAHAADMNNKALSDQIHFGENGEHNADYDHEAFLGEEAIQFKNLTLEETLERLGQIVNRIDVNNDTLVDVVELTNWIKMTQQRSVFTRTDEYWMRSNPDKKEELSWDEYRAIQYGFLSDGHITDNQGRWVLEDDVDGETLALYKQLELRDRRRWTVADRNKNLLLSKIEFLGFIHPESETHMKDIVISETMAEMDKDGDMKIDLAEYVKNIYGDTLQTSDWDSAGMQFRAWRDTNSDGFIDKQELEAWIMPGNYDLQQAEAEHLIHESDTNQDRVLSKEEILTNHHHFVESQATNFGDDLHDIVHDEL